jgi:hypothetical protein
LPLSVQETILAFQEAEDPATLELGPTRVVSNAEILVMARLQGYRFVTRVVERLNPDGCALLNAVSRDKVYTRILNLDKARYKLSQGLNSFVTENLIAFFKRDALLLSYSFDIMKKTQLLGVSTTTAISSSSDNTSTPLGSTGESTGAFDSKVTASSFWFLSSLTSLTCDAFSLAFRPSFAFLGGGDSKAGSSVLLCTPCLCLFRRPSARHSS